MSEQFSTLLKRAIEESGMTPYAIACKCGVEQSALSRFVSGERSLSLETVDKLVQGLGIQVRLPRDNKYK